MAMVAARMGVVVVVAMEKGGVKGQRSKAGKGVGSV